MNFAKTTSTDFTVIKDGLDKELMIIRHDDTGFFNITKIAKLVNRLKKKQGGKASGEARHWFENQQTKDLVAVCESLTTEDAVVYELKSGTPKRFAGKYVHPYLYDSFMQWLDVAYAIKVSIILDKLRDDANKKVVEQKDAKIDELMRKMDELLGHAETSNSKLVDIEDELEDVKEELVDTREEVATTMSHLTRKSLVSTMNPVDPNKHHHFVATQFVKHDGTRVIKMTTGQREHVSRMLAIYVSENNHEVVIPMFYNANGIDLRQNCKTVLTEFYRQRLLEINRRNQQADKAFNKQLQQEIAAHNKTHPNQKRVYQSEKRKTAKITKAHVGLKINATSIEYIANPHIGYDEIVDLVVETNESTQKNPMDEE